MDGVWPWNIGDTWKVYSDAAFGMNAFDQIDKFIKDLKRIRAKLGFHQQRVSSHAATSAADAPRPEAHSQSPSNSGVGASREVPGVVGRATECGTQATAAERRGEPRANVSKGMSWQDVRGRLLAQLESKAKAASMQDWAESIGCSVSTVQKAIRRTPALRALLRPRSRVPRAQSINDVVQDNAVVATQNPADAAAEQERRDKALARLLDKAKPEERAVLRAMPKEKLDELCRTLTETEDDEEMLPNGNTRLRNRRL